MMRILCSCHLIVRQWICPFSLRLLKMYLFFIDFLSLDISGLVYRRFAKYWSVSISMPSPCFKIIWMMNVISYLFISWQCYYLDQCIKWPMTLSFSITILWLKLMGFILVLVSKVEESEQAGHWPRSCAWFGPECIIVRVRTRAIHVEQLLWPRTQYCL